MDRGLISASGGARLPPVEMQISKEARMDVGRHSSFEGLLEDWDRETAVIRRDRESGSWFFVCLHSTGLGPAGARPWPSGRRYAHEDLGNARRGTRRRDAALGGHDSEACGCGAALRRSQGRSRGAGDSARRVAASLVPALRGSRRLARRDLPNELGYQHERSRHGRGRRAHGIRFSAVARSGWVRKPGDANCSRRLSWHSLEPRVPARLE